MKLFEIGLGGMICIWIVAVLGMVGAFGEKSPTDPPFRYFVWPGVIVFSITAIYGALVAWR